MDYKKHVEFFFLALISGIGSVGINFVAKISDNIVQMTIAVREVNLKLEALKLDNSGLNEKVHDHELRIRVLESKTK